MCIIAFQPKGALALPSATLDECWSGNPHGAGYMFAHGGEVQIRKAFFSLPALEDSYKSDIGKFGHSSPFVLHCRWATHGSKNILNTHPHPVLPGDVALVHNGVFRDVDIAKDEDISDTIAFIRRNLSWRNADQLIGRKLRKRLEKRISVSNKVVMLRADGAFSIVNEFYGEWNDGTWYSNNGYLPSKFSYHSWEDDDTRLLRTNWKDDTKLLPAAYCHGGACVSSSGSSSSHIGYPASDNTGYLFNHSYTDEYHSNIAALETIDDSAEMKDYREELAYLQLMPWDELVEEDWNRRHELEDYFDTVAEVNRMDAELKQKVRSH